jgi:hypothetical protein
MLGRSAAVADLLPKNHRKIGRAALMQHDFHLNFF